MKLKLDLEGILFTLEIINYRPSTIENCDDEWCEVSYYATNDVSLNYGMRSYDNILCSEVEELRDTIKKLLLDELTDKSTLSYIESGLSFHFIPKGMECQQLSLFDTYPPLSEAYAELRFRFWMDGWTRNYLTLHLTKEDIEHIKNYLNLVTGVVAENNPVIVNMIDRNILC